MQANISLYFVVLISLPGLQYITEECTIKLFFQKNVLFQSFRLREILTSK